MAVKKQQDGITELQLKAALEPITREINDLRLDLDKLSEKVVGNGNIGMDEIVRSMQRDINFMKKMTYFIISVGGAYLIVEVLKFLITGIAK